MGPKIQSVLCSPNHGSWHRAVWRRTVFDFCKTNKQTKMVFWFFLVDWPSLFLLLSLHAQRMSFSTSQTAALSVSPTLLHQPWNPCLGPLDSPTLGPSALDPLPSFFHSTCQKGPCVSGDIKKGLLYNILEPEPVSLERLERLFLLPPLFLAESSRRVSGKETRLLKSGNMARYISKIKFLLQNWLA